MDVIRCECCNKFLGIVTDDFEIANDDPYVGWNFICSKCYEKEYYPKKG